MDGLDGGYRNALSQKAKTKHCRFDLRTGATRCERRQPHERKQDCDGDGDGRAGAGRRALLAAWYWYPPEPPGPVLLRIES